MLPVPPVTARLERNACGLRAEAVMLRMSTVGFRKHLARGVVRVWGGVCVLNTHLGLGRPRGGAGPDGGSGGGKRVLT